MTRIVPKLQVAIILIAALYLAIAACTAGSQEEALLREQYRQGENIYTGKEHVSARIAGHQQALPAEFSKCSNCHKPAKAQSVKTESAPPLDSKWLRQARERRGGPAFAYTRENFCATLRSGIDPAYVILNRAMPRFEISEEQCHSLWLYLSEKRNNE